MNSIETPTRKVIFSDLIRQPIIWILGITFLVIGCLCGAISTITIDSFDSSATGEITITVQSRSATFPDKSTVQPTFTPYPTYTLPPTQTPYIITATATSTPKFTATFTNTPTITLTPTNTSTPTRTLPPTKTPTLTPTPNATKTEQAIINATKGADATATKEAKNVRATEVAQYEKISYKELTTYPDAHIGEKVVVEGRVFNINSNTELQIFLGWTYDAAYIVTRDPFSGIYEDNWVKIYGVVGGKNCGTNAYGAEVCQPMIIDALIETR